MEKKKRPPVHEAFIEHLNSPRCLPQEAGLIAYLYGHKDVVCPAKAIPSVIEALKSAAKRMPDFKLGIEKAITNLKAQLEEHKAEEIPDCTNCHGKLEKIETPDGLSKEEWNEQKRGDLFCPGCHRFFFLTDGELKPGHDD